MLIPTAPIMLIDALLASLEDARDIMKALDIEGIEYPTDYDEIQHQIKLLLKYGAESRYVQNDDGPTLYPDDPSKLARYKEAGIFKLFKS